MSNYNNEHMPNAMTRKLVMNRVFAGLPLDDIAAKLEICIPTLQKQYSKEIQFGLTDMIDKISEVAAVKAMNGDDKALALILKTRAARYGWVEKQVVQQEGSTETAELTARIEALEASKASDY